MGVSVGVILFAAVGMTFIVPHRAILDGILSAIVGFSTISLGNLMVFMLGYT